MTLRVLNTGEDVDVNADFVQKTKFLEGGETELPFEGATAGLVRQVFAMHGLAEIERVQKAYADLSVCYRAAEYIEDSALGACLVLADQLGACEATVRYIRDRVLELLGLRTREELQAILPEQEQ